MSVKEAYDQEWKKRVPPTSILRSPGVLRSLVDRVLSTILSDAECGAFAQQLGPGTDMECRPTADPNEFETVLEQVTELAQEPACLIRAGGGRLERLEAVLNQAVPWHYVEQDRVAKEGNRQP